MKFELKGIIPAILTPFTKGGKQVDFERAASLAVRLADQGVQGIFPGGTTGEGMLMTLDERKDLLEVLVKTVGKRIKVIAHTGCFDTASTIELTEHAAKTGAYAAAIVAPGFYGYDDISLRLHYASVAKAVSKFPILLYHIPGCAKNALSPELIIGLANDFENIVGMKDSGGSIQYLNRLLSDLPSSFTLINGCDEYTFQALAAGAKGCVSSTSNVVPEMFLGIYKNVQEKKFDQAWAIQKKLNDACRVFQYGAKVAFYKEGLRLRGFDAGFVRAPQRELNAAEKKSLAEALKQMKIK